ncbi:MAG TPA: ABC transporter permease [Bacteroidia bacterium]|nr:ABC transporter permease [Bacteroidia bacterium]HNT80038.1 ABC transporter permease [Bacteroidia bacterium]
MDLFYSALLLGLCYFPLGVGIYITLRIFNIPDITTDGSFTSGAAIIGICLINNVHPMVALILCLTGGCIAGFFTGFIYTKLKVNPLLAGILVMTALYSINLMIMGQSNIPLLNTNTLFSSNWSEEIILLLFTFLLLLLMYYFLRTDYGLCIRAAGNNENMVKQLGTNIHRIKILGLVIANACTALSGFLVAQYQGFSDINMGIGIVISGLASVMIGEKFSNKIKSNPILFALLFVLVGSILFRESLAAVLFMGLNPIYLKLITALIVLAIVGISFNKKKLFQ